VLDFPTWKRIWLWFLALVCIVAALPSLAALSNVPWPSALPDPQVNLGLDLAGGSQLLLEANPQEVARQRLEGKEEDVRRVMSQAEPRIHIGDVSTGNGRLTFLVDDPSQVDAAREQVLPLMNGRGVTREWNLEVVDGTRFVLTPTQSGIDTAVSSAMDSAIDVVRKRIDALGTREPTIIREGATPSSSSRCSARPPSSNSSWSTRPRCRPMSTRASPHLVAKSCPARRAPTTQAASSR
jgi:preprotein translocase subunit SecD